MQLAAAVRLHTRHLSSPADAGAVGRQAVCRVALDAGDVLGVAALAGAQVHPAWLAAIISSIERVLRVGHARGSGHRGSG